jgi:hypothetical protein
MGNEDYSGADHNLNQFNEATKLYHELLKVESLGAAALDLTHKLQSEIQEKGVSPRDLPSLGHLMMMAEMVEEIGRKATDA